MSGHLNTTVLVPATVNAMLLSSNFDLATGDAAAGSAVDFGS
jgi:hypothetical protein